RPAIVSEGGEMNNLRSFDEERALLGIKCLEGGEIENVWIRLHLSEVGIHRGVECEIARQTVLEVETCITEKLLAARGKVRRGIVALFARNERKRFDLPRVGQAAQSEQVAV